MGYIGKVQTGNGPSTVVSPIGSTLYGTCSTAAATTAKAVTCADFDTLIEGVTIHVKFTYGNSASAPTLNVNSTGAKLIKSNLASRWTANSVTSFTYDGQYWCQNDDYWVNNDTKVSQTVNTASNLSLPLVFGKYSVSGLSDVTDEVYVNPSIYVKPSGGGLYATTFNGYTLGASCAKAIGSVASGNTGLVTGGDVYAAIQSAAAGSLQYQGTATSNSDIGTSYHAGWYWIVGSAGGTIAGQTVEAGDMILAHANYSGTLADDLDIVQSNVDRITNSDIDTIVAA